MIKNIRIEKNFYYEYGFQIEFPFKAYDAVIFNDKLIVGFSYGDLQKADPNSEFWRAVWCYDKNGNLLWKVGTPYHIDYNKSGSKCYEVIDKNGSCIDAIQSVLYREEEDSIIVFGRMGYKADPETGELIEIVYKER